MAEYVGPSPELMEKAQHLWGTKGVFSLIRGNENWVYSLDGSDLIFRFTAHYHRSQKELEGEIEFINYLYEKECRVIQPVAAKDGSFVQPLTDRWCAVVFKRAPGRAFMDENLLTRDVFLNWGQTIGEMHKHIKEYQPSRKLRNEWDRDDGFKLAESMFPILGEDHYNVRVFKNIVSQIRSRRRTVDNYGLIHADIHHGNFFVDDKNQLIVFDFDDSMYHFLMFDLAVPMATMDMQVLMGRFTKNLRTFQNDLLEGYARVQNLPSSVEEDIEFFVRYRMAHLYLWGASRVHLKRTNDSSIIESMKSACTTYLRKFY